MKEQHIDRLDAYIEAKKALEERRGHLETLPDDELRMMAAIIVRGMTREEIIVFVNRP